MPIDVLQKLGLSLNEAKIYEALLDLKEAGVGNISSKADVHRRNVYDTLSRLIEKGLVFPMISKGENLYSPAEPDKLLQLIENKQNKLAKILPILNAKYSKREKTQEAYIYKGLEGIKNYMTDILKKGKDSYTIGVQLAWFDPRLKTFSERIIKGMVDKGAKFHFIINEGIKEKAPADLKKFNSNYKILPKEYCSNSAMDICGDYVITFSGLSFKKIDDDVTIFVLRDKQLADSYRTWFQFMFDHCPKATKLQKTEKQKTTTYTGKTEFRKAHFEAVKQMENNSCLYVMIASGKRWYQSMGKEALKKFDKIRKEKNISEKVVALASQRKERQQKPIAKRGLVDMKFLTDEFDNMSDTVVYGDVTLITFHGNPVFAVMIKNKEIAESYKKYFDILWKIAHR